MCIVLVTSTIAFILSFFIDEDLKRTRYSKEQAAIGHQRSGGIPRDHSNGSGYYSDEKASSDTASDENQKLIEKTKE